jgi:hypothetical protein
MPIISRRRRFVPALDSLPSRLTPSDGVITPMDPVLLGWCDTTTPEVVITPMDPVLLGWSDPTLDSTLVDAPVWLGDALAQGDGLIAS